MSVQVKYRRESTTFLSTYVGAAGEILVDTTKNVVVVQDGATPGGFAAARADQAFAAPSGTSRVGDLFYGTGGAASARLADVAAGSVLVSGGVNAPPAWSSALPAGVTIPTPAAGDTSTKVANMAAVAAAIAALVASSPAALDTLKELADAINDDPNFASTITNLIATKAAKGANTDITSLGGLTAPAAFTPAITFQTPGDLTVSYSTQSGFWYAVGKLVFVTISLVFVPTYSTATGTFRITGLPVAAASGALGALQVNNLSGSTAINWPGTASILVAQAVASYIQIVGEKTATAPANVGQNQVTSGNTVTVNISGVYLAA